MTWLTGVERPGLAGFKNTISIDQVMARKMGASTRFHPLILERGGGQSISWDANGVSIPCQASLLKFTASCLFREQKRSRAAGE